MMRTATFPDGTQVPALGQGTWHMGESKSDRAAEAAALQLGIELGMTLIDTAEMYTDGGAEEVVADAVAGQRDAVFVVSKVLPHNASRTGTRAACERSLRRLRTDRLTSICCTGRVPCRFRKRLPVSRRCRRTARFCGGACRILIPRSLRNWGPSPAAVTAPPTRCCTTFRARGPEFDLLPWCAGRGMPVMAYSPVGQGGALLRDAALRRVAQRHGKSTAQIALAWTLRQDGIISIPKASDPAHVRDNVAAADIELSAADLADIDAAFPPPKRKRGLEML